MVESHLIGAHHDTVFEHAYPTEAPDLRRLYENAKRDQWNVSRDVEWSQPFDIEQGVLADEMIDIYGTPFWDRLTPTQRAELNRKFALWRLGVLLYGEHGAMLLCSQLVECVSGPDAKFFQATQVVDEGRHNEVLHRYIALRLDGETYQLAGYVREIFDTLLGTSAWYLKTIGLQLVAEIFAVSLFRMLAESSKDEVLRSICRRICRTKRAIWASACCTCRRWWKKPLGASGARWRTSRFGR
jgi:P-aminobenzoate N-oxygenase AurF